MPSEVFYAAAERHVLVVCEHGEKQRHSHERHGSVLVDMERNRDTATRFAVWQLVGEGNLSKDPELTMRLKF
jgi:hypothetical protein